MSEDKELKTIPVFNTDEDAERFVDEANLADYDLSGFKPMRFEPNAKTIEAMEAARRGELTTTGKFSGALLESLRTALIEDEESDQN